MLLASDDVLIAYGKESFGNYGEIVDLKTGKTLAHRVYEKDVKRSGK
jgi:hypothetical protein